MNCKKCNSLLTNEDLICNICGEKNNTIDIIKETVTSQSQTVIDDLSEKSPTINNINSNIKKNLDKTLISVITTIIIVLIIIVPVIIENLSFETHAIESDDLIVSLKFPRGYGEISIESNGYIVETESNTLLIGIAKGNFSKTKTLTLEEMQETYHFIPDIVDYEYVNTDKMEYTVLKAELGNINNYMIFSELNDDYQFVILTDLVNNNNDKEEIKKIMEIVTEYEYEEK